jgi:hypothetical protein
MYSFAFFTASSYPSLVKFDEIPKVLLPDGSARRASGAESLSATRRMSSAARR